MWYRILKSQMEDNKNKFLQPTLPLNVLSEEEQEEDDFMDFLEKQEAIDGEIINNFIKAPKKPQDWKLIPATTLARIYNQYMKSGIIYDQKALDYVVDLMIKNVMRLQTNTALMWHTEDTPNYIIENTGNDPKKLNKKFDNYFAEHVLDSGGKWRISDYALKPLLADARSLAVAKSDEEKFQLIDHMLNIIHARSDMAGNFVEGGTATLNSLGRL